MSRHLNPFARPGRWYRGVFHCHTTNSDGARLVESVVAWYAGQGYDFVAITDHNQLTRDQAEGAGSRLLLVPGTEVDVGRTRLGESYHLVGIGLEEMIDVPRQAASRHRLAVQHVIDALRHAGAAVFVAHPYWSGLVVDDLLPLEGVSGIEVWNANTEVDIGKGYSGVHWDDCLSQGKPLFGAANDDAHWRMPDYGRAWTLVRAESLTRRSVVQALETGSFYASTGVVLEDVTFDGDTATVRVAAPGAQEIRFICDRRWGQRVAAEGEPLREAAHTLRGHERYLRIEVVSPTGARAWTNPLFVER
jgi:hypothetical protein